MAVRGEHGMPGRKGEVWGWMEAEGAPVDGGGVMPVEGGWWRERGNRFGQEQGLVGVGRLVAV